MEHNHNSSRTPLLHLLIDEEQWGQFIHLTKAFDQSTIEMRPYSRFLLAHYLKEALGQKWMLSLINTIKCGQAGGVIVNYPVKEDHFLLHLKLSTALAYSLGNPFFDELSGKYYANINLTHESQGDSFLSKPYLDLRLHTDGTFYKNPVDWIILAKKREENIIGGELSLHHLHSLEILPDLLQHPLAFREFRFQGSPSKKTLDVVCQSIFFEQNGLIAIRFSDQFCQPQTIDQALFLHQLSEGLECSPHRHIERFPIGQLFILNNAFWLHGRLKITPGIPFERQLLRIRGAFYIDKEH